MNSEEINTTVIQQPLLKIEQIILLCKEEELDLPSSKLKNILLSIATNIRQLSVTRQSSIVKEQYQNIQCKGQKVDGGQFVEEFAILKDNFNSQLSKLKQDTWKEIKNVNQKLLSEGQILRQQISLSIQKQNEKFTNLLSNYKKQQQQHNLKFDEKINVIQSKYDKIQTILNDVQINLKQNQIKRQGQAKNLLNSQKIKQKDQQIKKESQNDNEISKIKIKTENTRKQSSASTQQISQSNFYKKQQSQNDPSQNSNTPSLMAIDWVDSGYSLFKSLSLDKNKISTKLREGYVFGKNKLRDRNQYTIQINIMNKTLMLGIIDRKLKNFPVIPINRNIIYYASDGHSWQGKQVKSKQGSKLRQGQTVIVSVDFNSNTLTWRVDGQLKYNCICEQISDKGIDWMPYIFIGAGDSVSVIQ